MRKGAATVPSDSRSTARYASDTRLHERLLFTHIDLFYIEPEFWRCEALNNGVRMVSGRFVQEPLWLDGHSEPIPRPADDHILIDTEFYRNNGLVFRAYAKAGDAFAEAAWLADALPLSARRRRPHRPGLSTRPLQSLAPEDCAEPWRGLRPPVAAPLSAPGAFQQHPAAPCIGE